MPSSPSQNSGEPPVLLRTLFAAFSGVLFGLLLSKFKAPPQQSSSSISPNAEAENQNYGSGNFPSLSPKVPPAPTNSENSCKCCHHKTAGWKVVLEVATFIVAVLGFSAAAIYACITYQMWHEVQRGNDAAISNFVREERAWLGFSLGDLQIQQDAISKKPQALLIPFQIVNTGKTVAKKSAGTAVVTVINKGEKLSFNLADYSRYILQGGAMFPKGQMGLTQPAIKRGPDGIAHTIIPTEGLMRRIKMGESFPVVFGEVTYCDIFGVPHKTKFCRYITTPGLIDADCMKYNDADSNEKPDKQICPVTSPE